MFREKNELNFCEYTSREKWLLNHECYGVSLGPKVWEMSPAGNLTETFTTNGSSRVNSTFTGKN